MQKLIYIILIGLSSFSYAQDDALFKRGNAMYNEGKFQDAINSYEQILTHNKHSAELYFNLANAYYKTNQVAPSIYNYEKALRLAPDDKDIKNNLAFANNMTIDGIETIPKAGFSKIMSNITSAFSFDAWSMLSVTLVILFVTLFLMYYFSYSTTKKRLLFVSSFGSLFLSIIALTFAFNSYSEVKNDNPAIVFAVESEIKVEPNLRSEVAFNLHEGTKIQVLEDFNGNWSKIKLADGKIGWIPKSDIKLLNDF